MLPLGGPSSPLSVATFCFFACDVFWLILQSFFLKPVFFERWVLHHCTNLNAQLPTSTNAFQEQTAVSCAFETQLEISSSIVQRPKGGLKIGLEPL
jgi:hypothetical protein